MSSFKASPTSKVFVSLLICLSLVEKIDCRSCHYVDSTHAGLDLKPSYSTTSAEQCELDCINYQQSSICAGSTYDEMGNCYFHSKIEIGRIQDGTRPGATLFIRECTADILQKVRSCEYKDSTHAGLDMNNGYPASVHKCRVDCMAEAACAGSTHDEHGNCYLHYRIDQSRIQDGIRIGATLFVRRCDKIQTNEPCVFADSTHAGLDIFNYGYPASVKKCKDDCIAAPGCEGSTRDEHGNCYLHYRIEEERINKGTRPGATLYVIECRRIYPKGSAVLLNTKCSSPAFSDVKVNDVDDCHLLCMDLPNCRGCTYHFSSKHCKLHLSTSKIEAYTFGYQLFVKSGF